MRKLASIQRIEKLEEIPGGDKILKATVLGWNLVVRRTEFAVGDLCVYFEIDSILDSTNPAYEHLKKDGKLKHLKTIKLKGQISQGLALPISCLGHYGTLFYIGSRGFELVKKIGPDELIKDNDPIRLDIGLDVTELTNTEKYEIQIPACLTGLAKGNFPHFLRKTDEPRIQNYPEIINEIKGADMIGTLKCDGTSTTFYLKDDEFGVCSRNLNLKETEENSQWSIARKLDIEKKMREYRDRAIEHGWDFTDFAIQGELVGPGIQANRMGLEKPNVFFFNFWDIKNQKYRSFETLRNFCKNVGLETVPCIFEGTITEEMLSVQSLLNISEKLNYSNGYPAEGIVWRTYKETYSECLKSRTSFKSISNRFLLKNGE